MRVRHYKNGETRSAAQELVYGEPQRLRQVAHRRFARRGLQSALHVKLHAVLNARCLRRLSGPGY